MQRLNTSLIIVNGMARGGTNILWNIISSHPKIVLPGKETGQIFKYLRSSKKNLFKYIPLWRIIELPRLNKVYGKKVDRILFNQKLQILNNPVHKYKTKDEIYSKAEIEDCILCLKSLNNELFFTTYLNKIFDNVYNVGIIRDGYALCESLIRRNKSAKYAGKLYYKYGKKIINDSQKLNNYKIVKFEDVIKNPFEISKELFEFFNLYPVTINQIRLKSKKVLDINGKHSAKYGKFEQHYWFNETNITKILDTNSNISQKKQLTVKQINDFEENAMPILNYFGYIC